jgi:hypothetical protein
MAGLQPTVEFLVPLAEHGFAPGSIPSGLTPEELFEVARK